MDAVTGPKALQVQRLTNYELVNRPKLKSDFRNIFLFLFYPKNDTDK
jgi:hypothetical protein